MQFPHEVFPQTRTLGNVIDARGCEVTQRIIKQELQKFHRPATITGIQSFPDSNFKSQVLRHLAQKYNFYPRVLTSRIDYIASSFEFDLGGGVKLMARNMHPKTLEEDKTEAWFYLTLLYLNKYEYDGKSNALRKVKDFVQWLEEMKSCPIKTIFFRPYCVADQTHFSVLDMIQKPNATTERLTKAYKKVWRAEEIDVLDVEDKPYFKIPFQSK
mgnify:CR=1 FL=1|jgi:hypothetical protein